MNQGKLKKLPHLPSDKDNNIFYLSLKDIIYLNKEIIDLYKKLGWGHKGDNHKLKSNHKLNLAIEYYKQKQGDLYDIATELLISITQAHAFDSANRRTAYYSTILFLKLNDIKVNLKDYEKFDPRIMVGIREGNYYTFDEIKNWLKNKKIKRYTRS